MAKVTDLTGQTFGKLTVICRDIETQKKNNSPRTYWRCQCECGKIVSVCRNHLISGHTKSCGCQRGRKAEDLTNKIFSYLTVIEKSNRTDDYGKVFWKCKCVCGKIIEVSTAELNSGHTKSCGCQKGRKIEDLVGQKFNKLTVIQKIENKKQAGHTLWLCKCDCGKEVEVAGIHLKSGHTASCGCISSSLGEEHIEQFLIQNQIKYIKDKPYFKDLILPSGYIGRYDFILLDRQDKPYTIIEFDGLQHTKEWDLSNTTLQERQLYDNIKNEYAINHKIPLYRIPYSQRDNICFETLFNKEYLIE